MPTWNPASLNSSQWSRTSGREIHTGDSSRPKLTPNAGTTTTSRTRKPGPSHDTNSVQKVHRRVRERSAGLRPGVYGSGTEVELGPKGTAENSPAFQRRESYRAGTSPEGTVEGG